MIQLSKEPALGLLLRLKARGTARRMWRRMRSVRGLVLTLFGLGLVASWIFAILMGSSLKSTAPAELDPEQLQQKVRLGMMIFLSISVGGAFVHRGLFLPAAEIERLFAAPLSRPDLVRYRLLVSVGRSLMGGLIFAFLIARHLPNPYFGYLGALIAIQILPLVNQFLAIVAGMVEGRFAKALAAIGKLLSIFFILIALGVGFLVVTHQELKDLPLIAPLLTKLMPSLVQPGGAGSFIVPPFLSQMSLIFEPWARLLTATNWFDFATWAGVSLGLWVILFEATARLPVDFRELSLNTASSIAARIRRARKGGGVSSIKATQGVGWLRIPWPLGRGPARAIVWRKATTVMRKARGTLWISAIVLLFVTLLSSVISLGDTFNQPRFDSESGRVVVAAVEGGVEAIVLELLPSILIAFLGIIYLSGGLRFDFREDLDRMESMRSWPIQPARLFMATILPQVLLVSGLVIGALGLRVALTRELHPALLILAAFVPPFCLAWIALDNAAFLFMPVRVIPGQGGMIPNAGRAFFVIFLRMGLLALVCGVGLSAGLGTYFVAQSFWDVSPDVLLLAAVASTWGALVMADVCMLYIGGWLVSRFDVARDIP